MRKGTAGVLLGVLVGLLPFFAQAATSGELTAQQEYNRRKQLVSTTYVDREGNVTLAEDKGYAMVRYSYWKTLLLKTEFLDAEGNPVNRRDGGYATHETKYDASWRKIEDLYTGADGEPVTGPEGYARRTWVYEFKQKIREIRQHPLLQFICPAASGSRALWYNREYVSEENSS